MDRVEKAFAVVRRADFLPEDVKHQAGFNVPLPIGFGQTNSQPLTVEFMLNLLDPDLGQKILDVGSGSGWTSALLAYIVGSKGQVYAVEKIPELVQFGRENCERANISNVRFFEAGKHLGLPRYAPYDRILVSASARELPQDLVDQLKIGGKMVVPVGHQILEVIKISEAKNEITAHPGFVFVPLV